MGRVPPHDCSAFHGAGTRAARQTRQRLDGYLSADGIELADDVLDRIDKIVPPGVTINVADNM